jgi:hypothetical protein
MNWTELRPKLREKYGNRIGFFNDKYRDGTRRVKIYGVDQNKMKQQVSEISGELKVIKDIVTVIVDK